MHDMLNADQQKAIEIVMDIQERKWRSKKTKELFEKGKQAQEQNKV